MSGVCQWGWLVTYLTSLRLVKPPVIRGRRATHRRHIYMVAPPPMLAGGPLPPGGATPREPVSAGHLQDDLAVRRLVRVGLLGLRERKDGAHDGQQHAA